MKHIAILCLAGAAFLFNGQAFAGGKHTQGTVSLPHPVKVMLKNKDKLDLSKSQLKQIKEEVIAVYPPKIHEQMDKVKAFEAKIRKAILKDHKTPKQLDDQLTQLSKMKLKLTRIHIRALNKLTSILNDQQWAKVQKMLHKKKKHKKEEHKHHDH